MPEEVTPSPTTETVTPTTPPAEPAAPAAEPSLVSVETPPVAEPAAEFVPLSFDKITVPEGMSVSDGDRDKFLGIINDQEMTPEARAQALINLQAEVSKQASEAGSQAWTDMQTQWQDDVRKDPDIGGPKLDGVLSNVGKLVDQFGSPELRSVMDLTGAGNNVHVVKFLNTVAQALTEGGAITGNAPSAKQSTADRLYPSMAKGA